WKIFRHEKKEVILRAFLNKDIVYSMFMNKLNVVNINTLITKKSNKSFSYTSTSEFWSDEFKKRHNKCHINRNCSNLINNELHKLHIANWNIIRPNGKDEYITQSMRDELLMSNGVTFCYNSKENSKMIALVGNNENSMFIGNLLRNKQLLLHSIGIIFDYIEMRHGVIHE
ncbi:MAG: hypothetical protein ACO2ZM_07440, partial [Francisellaceae bacterium]